jgi:hypothetical protein
MAHWDGWEVLSHSTCFLADRVNFPRLEEI